MKQKQTQNLNNLWNNTKKPSILVTGVPEKENTDNGAE